MADPVEGTIASTIEIAGRKIGQGQPPYVVAELSGNHNGKLERAVDLVDVAKAAGADAVKLQTYTADTLTIDHDTDDFRIPAGLWKGRTLYELYQEASTPWSWHEALFARGRELGITVFSSPFDPTAVDFLESLDAPAYKIASFEAVDLALIEKVASTDKPLIISTGMANLAEIEQAVDTAQSAGSGGLILLHCVSAYPAPIEESNLRTLCDLQERFAVPVGLSDHTMGISVPLAAVALGACMIEKHITLARRDGGPDAAFSLEPPELTELVKGCREAWNAVGQATYERSKSERNSAVFRRSLYVVEDVACGEILTERNVRSIRPGFGLAPAELPNVLGRSARCEIRRGTALSWELIDRAEQR